MAAYVEVDQRCSLAFREEDVGEFRDCAVECSMRI